MENKKICRLCMSPSLVYHSLLTDDAIDKILSLTALQVFVLIVSGLAFVHNVNIFFLDKR